MPVSGKVAGTNGTAVWLARTCGEGARGQSFRSAQTLDASRLRNFKRFRTPFA